MILIDNQCPKHNLKILFWEHHYFVNQTFRIPETKGLCIHRTEPQFYHSKHEDEDFHRVIGNLQGCLLHPWFPSMRYFVHYVMNQKTFINKKHLSKCFIFPKFISHKHIDLHLCVHALGKNIYLHEFLSLVES